MDDSIYKKRALRAERKVEILEKMVEEKTRDLYEYYRKLKYSADRLAGLHSVLPQAVFVTNQLGEIIQINNAAMRMLQAEGNEFIGKSLDTCIESYSLTDPKIGLENSYETQIRSTNGEMIPVLVSVVELSFSEDSKESDELVVVCMDLRSRKKLELELRHAQKMESVGQLAAGIAHEINTPMQYVGDNVHFLGDAFAGLSGCMNILKACEEGVYENIDALKSAVAKERESTDIEFLLERSPKCIDRTLDGIQRVSKIINALKEFSHPCNEQVLLDVNRVINTALTVSRGEYKYLANIELDLKDVPLIYANSGDVNQLLLNMIVNAAHAIEEKKNGEKYDSEPGEIRISSEVHDKNVRITVSDNGCGVPKHIHHRIFDPFFTTKEVGKGTGQGLSISHNIVEKHGGKMSFVSEDNQGTTFTIDFPLPDSDE